MEFILRFFRGVSESIMSDRYVRFTANIVSCEGLVSSREKTQTREVRGREGGKEEGGRGREGGGGREGEREERRGRGRKGGGDQSYLPNYM